MSEATFAGARIKFGGEIFEEMAKVVEVRVHDSLILPDTFLVRISDAGLELVDLGYFDIGNEVEIELGGLSANTLTSVIKGEITSVEPSFGRSKAEVVIRGYDFSLRMHRTTRTRTYQNVTASDIARKVANDAGLSVGMIEEAGPNPPYKFVQQNNETDWSFLWRLARLHDFEVVVVDKTLQFRRAGQMRSECRVSWGEDLLVFKPRVSAIQQVEEVVVRGWDPDRKEVISATAPLEEPPSDIGIDRATVSEAAGGGTLLIADVPLQSVGEAEALARSVASQIGRSYLEAEGVCHGNENIRAGTELEIKGVGERFSGKYVCSATTHIYRGGKGYETQFTVSGRNPRTLVDLLTPASSRAWGSSIVIGIVTQNEDPEGLGRVRVKYPALGDDTEGWWARIAAPSAGHDRGLLMMPVVGDEVLLAFEHDDVHRPYVIGALWNGKDTPGDLVQSDGSFSLRSDKLVHISAKDSIAIKTDRDYTLETQAATQFKADGDVSIEGAAKMHLEAGTSLTIEGGSDVTIKAGGASVALRGGAVQVSATQIMLG
jgi:phage protein D